LQVNIHEFLAPGILAQIIPSLVKTRERCMGIGQGFAMSLFFASNAIYPIWIMPDWLKWIVAVNPLTYEVDGLRALMLMGGESSLGLGIDACALSGKLRTRVERTAIEVRLRRDMMYERILVPVDGSETATRGLQEAIKLAQGHHAKLRLLHVVNLSEVAVVEAAYPSGELAQRLRQAGEVTLKQALSWTRQSGLESEAIVLETPIDNTGELIVRQANEWPADIVVMGTHGRRGLSRMVLGSSAEFVLRRTQVPLLLVRSPSAS
jgi:nucleotide-binding universal stress UspA family protein